MKNSRALKDNFREYCVYNFQWLKNFLANLWSIYNCDCGMFYLKMQKC